MSLSTVSSDQAKEEAADWFARLNKRDVSAADMEAFRLWRKAPGHKEAYDAVDAFWRRSAALQADPDIQAAVSSALTRSVPDRKSVRRPIIGLGFAAAILAIGAVGGYALWGPTTYATDVGETRTVRLDDGSSIVLDTQTKVSVRYSRANRDIRLDRGQALFDVAHDATRPFVVTAGETSVKALGTRFDVRREDGGARVTLLRGAVEVKRQAQADTKPLRLTPGQTLSPKTTTPTFADVQAQTSWTTGRLVFKSVPLGEAVEEVRRYDRRKIELDVGDLERAPISGAFDAGDTETFVSAAAELLDLTVTRPEKGVFRLARSGAHNESP